MNSDVNTDIEDKTQRKVRARKQIDTDDESDTDDKSDDSDPSCLPAYPKAPRIHTSNIKIVFITCVF